MSYRISEARYAKGKRVISHVSDGSGYKTRAARLAGALGGRWVHRYSGYVVSPKQAERFVSLYEQGWDATYFGELEPPKEQLKSALS